LSQTLVSRSVERRSLRSSGVRREMVRRRSAAVETAAELNSRAIDMAE
jgi:hypothetical protein